MLIYDKQITILNALLAFFYYYAIYSRKQIREHRLIHDQLSRFSSKQMSRVQEEVKSLRMQLVGVSNSVQRGNHGMDKLKSESANVWLKAVKGCCLEIIWF